MAHTYVRVTLPEFRELLTQMKRAPDYSSDDARQEPFFEWLLPPRRHDSPRLSVRLYSSLDPDFNAAVGRPAGADAIRVVVVFAPRYYGRERVIYTAKRIHRVAGWQARILQRLRETWSLVRSSPVCSVCGDYMVRKKVRGEKREFWSCVRYGWSEDACRGARRLTA